MIEKNPPNKTCERCHGRGFIEIGSKYTTHTVPCPECNCKLPEPPAPEPLPVKKMVEAYLRDNSFEGLCNDDCGCGLDDLEPCSQGSFACTAAYKVVCGHCGNIFYAKTKDSSFGCPFCSDV